MKKTLFHLLLFINLVIISLLLSSCFTTHTFLFKEGDYVYDGDVLPFYEDINITYISLNFKLADKSDDEENIIKNYNTKKNYFVTFITKTDKDKVFNVSFKLQKGGNEKDRYRITVDLSDLINVNNAKFEFALKPTNNKYFYEEQSQENTLANEINISILSSDSETNNIREKIINDIFILDFKEK